MQILLDLESAAINAFTAAYPNARILGYCFHLTQSDLRKSMIRKIGMKTDYESDDAYELLCAVHVHYLWFHEQTLLKRFGY